MDVVTSSAVGCEGGSSSVRVTLCKLMLIRTLLLPVLLVLLLALLTFWLGVDFLPDFRLDRKRDDLKNPGDDRRRPLPDLVVDLESIEEDDEIMPLV